MGILAFLIHFFWKLNLNRCNNCPWYVVNYHTFRMLQNSYLSSCNFFRSKFLLCYIMKAHHHYYSLLGRNSSQVCPKFKRRGIHRDLSPLRSLYGYLSLVQFSRIVVSSSLRPHRHLPHQMVCGLFSNLIEDSMCLLTMYGQPYLETANLDTFP